MIYLSEQATAEYFETPAQRRRNKFIQHFLEGDAQRIEKFSTGTSVTVWNRSYFLTTGGNDPDFEGWGDRGHRVHVPRHSPRQEVSPMPEEFSLDYRNFQSITEYRGWKSIYRLFGDMTFQKGMVLFHAWHPVEDRSAYAKAKERNRNIPAATGARTSPTRGRSEATSSFSGVHNGLSNETDDTIRGSVTGGSGVENVGNAGTITGSVDLGLYGFLDNSGLIRGSVSIKLNGSGVGDVVNSGTIGSSVEFAGSSSGNNGGILLNDGIVGGGVIGSAGNDEVETPAASAAKPI